MQGAVQSCVTCGVQYAMHQSMQKNFGDASEMHWKGMEFNMQGHTLKEPGDVIYAAFIPPEWEEQYIGATDTPSQWLAQEAQKAEESQPLEDMVPVQYHNFRDVFSKEAFNKLPPWKAWDHAIDLTPGAELPHCQTFPLSPAEQKELDN